MAFNIVAGVNNAVYGSVSGSGSYEEGVEVTLEVTANDGYRFVKWSDDNTDNPRIFNATEDVTLTATLEMIPEYSVILNSNNSNLGSVSGSGNYLEGSTATISATPNLHCRFVKWDDDNTDNPRSIIVNSAITLEAVFETVNWYSISTSVNDATMGSVTGAGDYDEGDTVTLTATANTDYKFVMWRDENTDNPRTFTASASGSYEAVLQK
ncbi:MAG: InlB B-repeat-containing protein [Pseudobutyrivibrio sp.]|nr:InlB B-repeat-containing protein [Pseudobutyrivibrio sp.]